MLTRRSWASWLPAQSISTIIHRTGRNGAHNVDVTKLVQPEVVRRAGSKHEVTLSQLLVEVVCGKVEFMQDPTLNEAFLASGLSNGVSKCTTIAKNSGRP